MQGLWRFFLLAKNIFLGVGCFKGRNKCVCSHGDVGETRGYCINFSSVRSRYAQFLYHHAVLTCTRTANLLTLCPVSSRSTTDNEDIRCGQGFTIFTLWRGYQCTVCALCAPSQPSRPGTTSAWPLLQQSLCEFLRLAYLGHKVGPGVCKIALCGGDISAECVPSVPRLNRRDQVLAPGPSCSNLCASSCGLRI